MKGESDIRVIIGTGIIMFFCIIGVLIISALSINSITEYTFHNVSKNPSDYPNSVYLNVACFDTGGLCNETIDNMTFTITNPIVNSDQNKLEMGFYSCSNISETINITLDNETIATNIILNAFNLGLTGCIDLGIIGNLTQFNYVISNLTNKTYTVSIILNNVTNRETLIGMGYGYCGIDDQCFHYANSSSTTTQNNPSSLTLEILIIGIIIFVCFIIKKMFEDDQY
jgi:hypothetical protein